MRLYVYSQVSFFRVILDDDWRLTAGFYEKLLSDVFLSKKIPFFKTKIWKWLLVKYKVIFFIFTWELVQVTIFYLQPHSGKVLSRNEKSVSAISASKLSEVTIPSDLVMRKRPLGCPAKSLGLFSPHLADNWDLWDRTPLFSVQLHIPGFLKVGFIFLLVCYSVVFSFSALTWLSKCYSAVELNSSQSCPSFSLLLPNPLHLHFFR